MNIKVLISSQSFRILIIAISQLILTLLTQLLIIRYIGINSETDAYIAAQAIPLLILTIVTAVFQGVWLPKLATKSNKLSSWKKLNSIALGQAAILGIGLLMIVFSIMHFLIEIIFPGFSNQAKELTEYLCLLLMVATVFNIQSIILTIALRVKGKFLLSEAISLLATIFSFVAIYFFLPIGGVKAVVWVLLAKAIMVYLALLNFSTGKFSIVSGLKFKSTWGLMRPLFFGNSLIKTTPIVDRYWASQSTIGALTTLNLAQIAINAVASILDRTLNMPHIPTLTKFLNEKNYSGLKDFYKKILLKVFFWVLISILLLIFSKDLFIYFVTLTLKINPIVAYQLWLLCVLLGGHLYAAIAGNLLVSVFYALQDTRTPMIIGIVGFIVGFILKWFLFIKIDLIGLVIASSVYFLINILMFFFVLEKKISILRGVN